MKNISDYLLPLIFCFVFIAATIKKADVTKTFAQGALNGLRMTVELFPSMLLLSLTIGVFTSSGALDLICRSLEVPAKMLNLPSPLIPLTLLRPLSGSGALVIFRNILSQFGPDSFIGKTASVMMGSTETTFYTIALYCSAANIQKSRYAVPASLCADLMGFFASVIAVKLLLS